MLDKSRYYKNMIKSKKDFISYINNCKNLEIVSLHFVKMIDTIRTQKEQEELEKFFGYKLETTCKELVIKIKDTNSYLTIYYNDYEDLKQYDKDNFNQEMIALGYKQVIYKMLY